MTAAQELRALAAGTIGVGFDGAELSPETAATFDELAFGSVMLFGRNVRSLQQARALTDAIRARYPADLPPVVAIDQEGGRVARIRDGVEQLPAMMAVGAARDAGLARRAGEQTAFDLRRAGVTLDYAPVLDLALEPMNTAIGSRAFGADPALVGECGDAFARGLNAGGIVPTFKHFPGHGSTAVDSHLGLPVVSLDAAAFRARDLAPFARVLPGARAVMTAHIVFTAIDAQRPATLSRALLTGVLRGELGFGGVCFTDCMQMDAIARTIGSAAGAPAALAAGADCVLISHSIEVAREAVQRIEEAVESGALPFERLRDAYERVRALRAAGAEPIALDAPSPHPGAGREIGRRAVTLLRGEARADATAAIAVSFQSVTTEGAQGTHAEHASLLDQAPALEEILAPLEPDDAATRRALDALDRSGRRPIVLMRRAHVYRAQAAAIERILAAHPDALLVSAREPFDVPLFPRARHVVCTYGDERPSIAGLADVLFGGSPATGRLPVELSR